MLPVPSLELKAATLAFNSFNAATLLMVWHYVKDFGSLAPSAATRLLDELRSVPEPGDGAYGLLSSPLLAMDQLQVLWRCGGDAIANAGQAFSDILFKWIEYVDPGAHPFSGRITYEEPANSSKRRRTRHSSATNEGPSVAVNTTSTSFDLSNHNFGGLMSLRPPVTGTSLEYNRDVYPDPVVVPFRAWLDELALVCCRPIVSIFAQGLTQVLMYSLLLQRMKRTSSTIPTSIGVDDEDPPTSMQVVEVNEAPTILVMGVESDAAQWGKSLGYEAAYWPTCFSVGEHTYEACLVLMRTSADYKQPVTYAAVVASPGSSLGFEGKNYIYRPEYRGGFASGRQVGLNRRREVPRSATKSSQLLCGRHALPLTHRHSG